jgi:oligogalacturonide lyase
LSQRPIGRRAFLALSASTLLSAQSVRRGAESTYRPYHFLDAATELDLFRITDPQFDATLPFSHLHFISRRGHFLLYSSNQPGSRQIYRLDYKSGQSKQLTAAETLDAQCIALTPDERGAFFFDGSSLREITLSNLRDREIVRLPGDWQRSPPFAVDPKTGAIAWVESKGVNSRVQVVQFGSTHTQPATAIETTESISALEFRPDRNELLVRTGANIRVVRADGSASRTLKLGTGEIGQALWSPDGRTLLYLVSSTDRQPVTLRELAPDEGTDRLVAKTSQFASFGVNGDASVFVGASRSLASPYILLLLRVAKRELALCEHRSSDPVAVSPVFSPDSQNVFFTSNRQGRHAIFRLHVERFVEETGNEGDR